MNETIELIAQRVEELAERLETANQLLQTASNLIADDLTDCDETSAPEHFEFLRKAADFLGEENDLHLNRIPHSGRQDQV